MSSQNGAFELLRADRGGASRPLIPIPMANKGGYSIPYLKEIVTSNAAIYIRPMQHKLDLERTSQPSSPNYQAKTKYVNCGTEILIKNLKETPRDAVKEIAVCLSVNLTIQTPKQTRNQAHD